MARGDDLYRLVAEYSELGVHRTGTDVDRTTAEWFTRQLAARGFEPSVDSLAFDQWCGESTLIADGEPVEHLPVYYEFEGEIDTDAPMVMALDPMSGGFPGIVAGPAAEARAAGADALILSTTHPDGSLVAINRVPGAGSGVPTVLIAGRDHERLSHAASRRLHLRAWTQPGSTATVCATGGPAGPPLVLTTPLTGWFGCAGERGTGIAVLLDLATRLTDVPVLVAATGGHELDMFGARQWVAGVAGDDLRGVVHVGASVASEEPDSDGGRRLATTRLAMTSVDGAAASAMAAALAPAALDLGTGATSWIGEAEVFAALGVPMLSLSGAGPQFHTPEDTPEAATSPRSLETAADAVFDAVTAFDQALARD